MQPRLLVLKHSKRRMKLSNNSTEIELCFIAEIKNRDGLKQATDIEHHEQWEYRIPPAEDGRKRGRIRVRATNKQDQFTYTETIKTPHSQENNLGDTEYTQTVTREFFEVWKSCFASTGQKKTRYTFVTDNVKIKVQGNELSFPTVKFEVDIFYNKEGKPSAYAKIDVEVQEIIEHIKKNYPDVDAAKFEIDFSSLPLDIGQVYNCGTEDEQERAMIDTYFKVFSIPYEVPNPQE